MNTQRLEEIEHNLATGKISIDQVPEDGTEEMAYVRWAYEAGILPISMQPKKSLTQLICGSMPKTR